MEAGTAHCKLKEWSQAGKTLAFEGTKRSVYLGLAVRERLEDDEFRKMDKYWNTKKLGRHVKDTNFQLWLSMIDPELFVFQNQVLLRSGALTGGREKSQWTGNEGGLPEASLGLPTSPSQRVIYLRALMRDCLPGACHRRQLDPASLCSDRGKGNPDAPATGVTRHSVPKEQGSPLPATHTPSPNTHRASAMRKAVQGHLEGGAVLGNCPPN